MMILLAAVHGSKRQYILSSSIIYHLSSLLASFNHFQEHNHGQENRSDQARQALILINHSATAKDHAMVERLVKEVSHAILLVKMIEHVYNVYMMFEF